MIRSVSFFVPVIRQNQEVKKADDILLLPGATESLKTAFPPPVKCSLVGPSPDTLQAAAFSVCAAAITLFNDTLGEFFRSSHSPESGSKENR